MTSVEAVRRFRFHVERGDLATGWQALMDLPDPHPPEVVLYLAECELALGDDARLRLALARLTALRLRDAPDALLAFGEVLCGAVLSCLCEDALARSRYEAGFAFDPTWAAGEYGGAYVACLIELDAFAEAHTALEPLRLSNDRAIVYRTMHARLLRRQEDPQDALLALRFDEGPADDLGLVFEAACIFHALGLRSRSVALARRARTLNRAWFDKAVSQEPSHLRPVTD